MGKNPTHQKHLTLYGIEEAETPQLTLKPIRDKNTPDSLKTTSENILEQGVGSKSTEISHNLPPLIILTTPTPKESRKYPPPRGK